MSLGRLRRRGHQQPSDSGLVPCRQCGSWAPRRSIKFLGTVPWCKKCLNLKGGIK